jgi:UDP-N-acetylmuramate--alanine ligase
VLALPGGQMRFTWSSNGPTAARCPSTLNLPGEHNVRNALAAIAVATELEVPDAPIVQRALAAFAGVGRRFQRYGELPSSDTVAPSR